jgi:hypothetical protein
MHDDEWGGRKFSQGPCFWSLCLWASLGFVGAVAYLAYLVNPPLSRWSIACLLFVLEIFD